MIVRLTQIDGVLPNIALMKLAHWHRERGDEVYLTRKVEPDLFEPKPDIVYGSSIFEFSAGRVARLKAAFPNAIVSGTGINPITGGISVEKVIGQPPWGYEHYDYSLYPDFAASIGFTQRGCRLKCKFCGVHTKEGKPISLNAIEAVWRGPGHPKKLHILDNDFFGQPDWRDRIREIRDGRFRFCMSQGINIRLINQENAEALATLQFKRKRKDKEIVVSFFQDTEFQESRLYTAWDNLKDEAIFFRGIDTLERAGIESKKVMAYMLVGFDKRETWPRIWHRFKRMEDRGIQPYPMVFDRSRADLLCFQRWAVTGLYRNTPWPEYRRQTKTEESVAGWHEVYGDAVGAAA